MKYYLLSLKWSNRKEHYVWWGPNECGYTNDINKAGTYDFGKTIPLRYMNKDTVAVPVETVEKMAMQRVVPTLDENWKAMNIKVNELPEY